MFYLSIIQVRSILADLSTEETYRLLFTLTEKEGEG